MQLASLLPQAAAYLLDPQTIWLRVQSSDATLQAQLCVQLEIVRQQFPMDNVVLHHLPPRVRIVFHPSVDLCYVKLLFLQDPLTYQLQYPLLIRHLDLVPHRRLSLQ